MKSSLCSILYVSSILLLFKKRKGKWMIVGSLSEKWFHYCFWLLPVSLFALCCPYAATALLTLDKRHSLQPKMRQIFCAQPQVSQHTAASVEPLITTKMFLFDPFLQTTVISWMASSHQWEFLIPCWKLELSLTTYWDNKWLKSGI